MRLHKENDNAVDAAGRAREVLCFLSYAMGGLDPRTVEMTAADLAGLTVILDALSETMGFVERNCARA